MPDSPWEQQRRFKHRYHDIAVEDIPRLEIEFMRGDAAKEFVETRESDNVKLIIGVFLGYLTSKGYRVVKQ